MDSPKTTLPQPGDLMGRTIRLRPLEASTSAPVRFRQIVAKMAFCEGGRRHRNAGLANAPSACAALSAGPTAVTKLCKI